jgi:hypothetical protein
LVKSSVDENNAFVSLTRHARNEMRADGMDSPDVLNVLRAGRVFEDGEYQNGSWRYRVHTEFFCVVVAFRGPNQLVVVTVWRK